VLGTGIEIPSSHLQAGIVEPRTSAMRFITIRSAEKRPENATVRIRFRDWRKAKFGGVVFDGPFHVLGKILGELLHGLNGRFLDLQSVGIIDSEHSVIAGYQFMDSDIHRTFRRSCHGWFMNVSRI